ncbi:ABC transporter substrate-binding protein [Amycolatopsis nigrescens]|uniref:ABC transporter substrate-binding protein n=1 Tax=Amycolatopsis nigrescens TaxID=381445 RepID=UPI0003AB352C|nr:ABC transporter substrate-binding protein [Amycolatopsis nigrescens]
MTPSSIRLSRRGFLTGVAALGTTTALAACGFQEDQPTGGGATWDYTDDRGRSLTGERPARIVAQVTAAAALWEYGIRPIGVFGPSKLPDGRPDPQVGAVDLNTVTSLGNVWGEFNADKYLSLNPQLLVSVMYVDNELWYVPKEQAGQIDKAAPSAGIDIQGLTTPQGIEKFAALAKALGADLNAPAVTEAKAAFQRADAEFAEVAKRTSSLRVMGIAALKDAVYVVNPPAMPSIKHFAQQGMQVVVPEKPDATGYYEQLSWENVNRYPADVIMYDNRFGSLTPQDLTGNATWSQLPAVKAGRLIGWNSESPLSYRAFTDQLTKVTADLRRFSGT